MQLTPGSKKESATYIRSLTGARFAAALWIVLFHFHGILIELFPSFSVLSFVFLRGHYAVVFFFILSGFILSHSYPTLCRPFLWNHLRFLWLRVARLWPVHATMLLLLCLYLSVAAIFRIGIDTKNYPSDVLLPEVLMIRCWADTRLLWNYPAWSIHAEWFAYIFIFPVCIVVNSTRMSTWLRGILCLGLLALDVWIRPTENSLWSIFLPFTSGAILLRLRTDLPDFRHSRLAISVAIGFVLGGLFVDGTASRLLFHCGFALFVFSASYDRGWVCEILSSRWAEFGGRISYSLYMSHALVQQGYFTLSSHLPLQSFAGRLAALSISITALFLMATLCYRFVETPCNRVMRNWQPLGR